MHLSSKKTRSIKYTETNASNLSLNISDTGEKTLTFLEVSQIRTIIINKQGSEDLKFHYFIIIILFLEGQMIQI